MAPAQCPLSVYRGDTSAWRFRLWADDDRAVPYDLAGAVVAAQVRREPDARAAIELGCTVDLPNEVTIRLDADTAARLPPGRWDMQATWPDGRVATLVAGAVTVTPDVTRE